MTENSFLNRVNEALILIIISFVLGGLFGYCSADLIDNDKKDYSASTIKLDSLVKVNDSIKFVVERLDSVKNAKVIEVSTLDNDSTVKLFYKLVKE